MSCRAAFVGSKKMRGLICCYACLALLYISCSCDNNNGLCLLTYQTNFTAYNRQHRGSPERPFRAHWRHGSRPEQLL